jgi:hypothetical protein
MWRHLAAKVGTVRTIYRASTISLQAAVGPEHTLWALITKKKKKKMKTYA